MNADAPMLELLTHTAAKGATVLTVALLLGLALKKLAAARRYAIWISAVAALAVLPLAMALLPAWHVLPKATTEMDWPVLEPEMPFEAPVRSMNLAEPETRVSASSSVPVPTAPPKAATFVFSWEKLFQWLPTMWIVIVGVMLLRLAWSAWCLMRLESVLQPGRCDALAEIAHEIGLSRVPRLFVGDANAVPMVWGVWRQRLLLSAGFETWTTDKLRSVLLHELAHLKRRDPLALWTAQWVKALHWFNPLAWLTIRQLRADQERACDDAVLRQGVRPSDYAQSLLDLSRHSRIAPGLALCALTITRCAPVEARVKAILDPNRRREPITRRWLACLAGFALLITLPVAMLHAIEGPKLRGRILDRNGVVLAESTKEKVRTYPLKTLAAHMIGYTRTPDEKHAQFYGGAALEEQHDAELAAGKDVTLTLDMRMQSLAYRAMKEAGVTRSAAVVLNPRTGEILAAVSLPSFDPNLFIPSITLENWESYLGNRDIPLLNRCLKGFTPGSTYKLLTGLAGGAAGISGQKFNCAGSVTYGSTVMQCWKQRQDGTGHGVLGMSEALAASCTCYWYQFGNAVGIEQIESMGRKIGFGSVYGISDHEDAGILPSPAWLKQHRPAEKWSNGYTANTSIGQGMVLATPLQMAVLAATVGNGGKVPQPGIVKQNGESPWRADLTKEALTAAAAGHLREGMRLVVNADSGTGKAARSEKVIIAGKTGTAQNWRRDAKGAKQVDNHGWFIGFAPFENPTLAFAIIKNGARSGGGDCGPIAKRIVEEALALPADGSGEVKPVEEPVPDTEGPEIVREIDREMNALGIGVELKEKEVMDGKILLSGEAESLNQALKLFGRLQELGEQRNIQWQIPVPALQENGRATFRAVGTYQTTQAARDKATTPQDAAKAEKNKGADGSGEVKPVGDANGDAWEKAEAQRSTFDAKAAAISSAIHRAKPEAKADFVLSELKIGHGEVTLHGTASDMFQALEFLGNLVKLGDQFEIEWASPGPKTMKDGTRVEFQARGIYQPAVKAEKGVTGQLEKLSTPDPAARLKQMAVSAWNTVRLGAALPELPVGAVIQYPPPDSSSEGPKARGAFTAPREEALLWLRKSLRHESEQLHAWPAKPQPFKANYRIHKGEIIATSQDGENVHLYVWLESPLPDLFRRKIMEVWKSADAESNVQPENSQNSQIRQQSDDAIRMRATDADNWKFLKGKGLLADLPAEAVVPVLSAREKQHSSGFFKFRFSAPRAAVRQWLLESLRVKAGHEETFLNWPEKPKTFYRTYSAVNDCQIIAQCSDGEKVLVVISKQKPRILIAPDEATPPTPKTAAPKELKGVVSGESQPPFVWPGSSAFPLIHLQDPQPPEDELTTAMRLRASSYRMDKSLLVNRAAR